MSNKKKTHFQLSSKDNKISFFGLDKINSLFSGEHLSYILKNGGISFIFKILGVFLGFLVIYIVTNHYNEKYYGAFALMQVIIQLLVIVFSLGLPNILVIEANKNIENKTYAIQLLKSIYFKIFLIGIIPAFILFVGAPYISEYIFLKPNLEIGFKIMGVSLIFFLLYETTLNFFVAQKCFFKYGLFMFVMPNMFFILFMVLFKTYVTSENYIFFLYSLSFIFSLILAVLSINWKSYQQKIILPEFNRLLKDSTPIMLSTVTMFLLNWVAVIILGRYTNEAQVGIYNTAFKIGLSVQLVMLTINIIIAPKVADLYHNKKNEALKTFIHQSTWLITIITFPLALFVIIFNHWLLGFFGEEFVIQGSFALIIITISTLINAVTGNVDQILNMTGNQKSFFRVIFLALVINVVFNLIFIPKFGINGAALACLVATIFMNVAALIVIKRKLGYYTLF